MKESSIKDPRKSPTTKVCGPQESTKSGRTTIPEKSTSKRRACNRLDSSALISRAKRLKVAGLKIYPDIVERRGNGYFYVRTVCQQCGVERWKELRNMEKGLSSKCQCQGAGKATAKWPHVDPSVVHSLQARYQAMRQRCEKDTHVSSHRYKGRGIEVLFTSRDDFVNWALETWPGESFRGKDFDRIDNDGPYSKENLRLVDRTTNLLNRSDIGPINVGTARAFKRKFPQVRYTERTVLGLLRCGLTESQILEREATSLRAGWRKPTTS